MRFDVNAQVRDLPDVPPWESLLSVLRDRLGLYGAKNACEQGECGSCTVLLEGAPVCACLVPAARAAEREVVTIEGLDDDVLATSVREAIRRCGGVQCGFCTPGFVVSATATLRRDPCLAKTDLPEALSGNLCRCTGYRKILQAVEDVARPGEGVGGSDER
ncbi:(2Fe-2S)-binding protein [Nocardioides sp. LHD-245]|uniref:(2Fe-2S)-binding protein n=1 Tax=Nocardioides sp. LHD-245 TaxID=3051387 RepID=UPI0027E13A8A|nr:(2Fe-2S)-binding protein [Nocardioides sp. LHD-245]